MEFDKNKILTVVTADQLKEGQMGWINDYVDYLKSDIKNISPYKVFRTNENMCPCSIARRTGFSGPTRCVWPTNSSRLVGLISLASGSIS